MIDRNGTFKWMWVQPTIGININSNGEAMTLGRVTLDAFNINYPSK